MSKIEIRKQIVLRVPREKVWEAVSTREGMKGWFMQDVEGGFQVGDTMRCDFGEHGIGWSIVVERVEGASIAFKGHPGGAHKLDDFPESEMTTARFVLEDHPDGTLLTVIDSGFENLPVSRRDECFKGNTEGWNIVAGWLLDYVERGIVHSRQGGG